MQQSISSKGRTDPSIVAEKNAQIGHAKADVNDRAESVETVLQILRDVIKILGPVVGDPLCRWLLILLFLNREQGL